jgi:hypothetical protein
MRMPGFNFLYIAVLSVGLSGCSFFAIGPDLDKTPTPFGPAPIVRLILQGADTPPIEIRHSNTGDTALVPASPMSKDKSFDASMTYYAFKPAIEDHKDYWLVGINIFKTTDRSAYAVIRYPQGTQFTSGHSTAAEMLIMSCAMRGVYPPLTQPLRQEEAISDNTPVSESADNQNGNGWTMAPTTSDDKICDFNSQDELYAFLPDLIRAAANEVENNKKKGEDEQSSDYRWEPIRIVIP